MTGIFTGVLIFSFNLLSTQVIHHSVEIYHFVRENPIWIPALLLAVVLLGLLAGLMLKLFPSARGGSLPIAVAHLRGHIAFKWIPNIVFVYISSMITYLVGLPLGNEAPCVQMGAAVGKGTVSLFTKKHRAWERYVMTGGACAGFAVTTGAPLSGIFFALEEAHRRFTPMVIMVATISTSAAILTSRCLCHIFRVELTIITVALEHTLRLRDIWAVILVAIVCAFFAALFSKTYEKVRHVVLKIRERVHFVFRLLAVFLIVALCGLISGNFINDGHNLLHEIVHNEHVWTFLLLYLFVRSILVIFSNSVGATGGLFVPTLVFGAMLGSICAQILISLGVLPAEYAPILIVIGMASYKGASMRTPITAIVFAVEVLSGLGNIPFVVLAVAIAYLVVELLGAEPVMEFVYEARIEQEHEGKERQEYETSMMVQSGSFAVGKQTRDIFWPPECVVMAVRHPEGHKSHGGHAGMHVGDMVDLHFATYDLDETKKTLCSLLGDQIMKLKPFQPDQTRK
ncbi:MAG: chloride channel protein [Clostridia bacterium]|nr:chloride channel protein [Clostridia bacterium]